MTIQNPSPVAMFIGQDVPNGDVHYYASNLDIAVHAPYEYHSCAVKADDYGVILDGCTLRRALAYDSMCDLIHVNAFNGFGDNFGDDEYGMSVAWLDLDDYLSDYGMPGIPRNIAPDTDKLTAWLKLHPRIKGRRWVLSFLDSHGIRSLESFPTKRAMMAEYRRLEKGYTEHLDTIED